MDHEAATRWSSRKFWTMAVAQSTWVVLLVKGILPVDAFVSLTYMTLGGYLIVNAGQHILERKK
jgi:lipid-binding SYLF domain-containing protein